MRFVVKCVGNLLFFGGPFLILLVGFFVWLLAPLFGPIHAEQAEPLQIAEWILCRDFEKQSDQTMNELTRRVESLLVQGKEPPSEIPMNEWVRSAVAHNLARRREKMAAITFPVDPDNDYFTKKPQVERNIMKMVKTWLLRQAEQYDALEPSKKAAFLQQTVDEIKWWNGFYNNVHQSCGLSAPTLFDLAKESELSFQYFRQTTPPEPFEKMVRFRSRLQSALIVSEANDKMQQWIGPIIPKSDAVRNPKEKSGTGE